MNVLILTFIAANVLISIQGFNNRAFFDKYKFNVGAVQSGQKYRMFSAAFLHVDWMHLFFNMYALFLFGEVVEAAFGTLGFILIYVVSLLSGNILSFLFHRKEPYYSAVGASGAVSGILYASVLVYPDMSLILFPIPIPLPAYVFAIGYMLYSIYGMKKQIGNIGHSAHIGGAFAGFLMAVVLWPSLLVQSPILSFVLIGSIVLFYIFRNRIFR
ncbi:MAG: rhomboid family intramembrane serine protease [Flavobacteriaceae bacterium]